MKLIYEKSQPGRRASLIPRHESLPRADIPEELRRTEPPRLPEVPEFELVRHFTELSTRNFGVDTGFYPLGSCTMKYNPRINERLVTLPGFANLHPLQDEDGVQGGDVPREVASGAQCGLAAAFLPGQRRYRLLDQGRFPVRGRLDHPEVARLHTVLAQVYRRPQHGKCLNSVRSGAADEPVVFQLGEEFLGRTSGGEQFAPGHRHRGDRGGGAGPAGSAIAYRAVERVEPFLDHAQRQVLVALRGQDEAEPLDVGGREPAVAR